MEKYKKETQWSPDGEVTKKTEPAKPANTCISNPFQNDTTSVNLEEIPTEQEQTTKLVFPPVHSIKIDFTFTKR